MTMQICLWHVLKNVAFHIKIKWTGAMTGSSVERITTNNGSTEETDTEIIASRLLGSQDRELRLGEGVRNARLAPPTQTSYSMETSRKYSNDPDGLLLAFRTAVYCNTEQEFWDLWSIMKKEFSNQQGRVNLLLLEAINANSFLKKS